MNSEKNTVIKTMKSLSCYEICDNESNVTKTLKERKSFEKIISQTDIIDESSEILLMIFQ